MNDVNRITYWGAAPAGRSAPQSSPGNGPPFPQGCVPDLLSAGLGSKVLEQLGWTTLRHHSSSSSPHYIKGEGFSFKTRQLLLPVCGREVLSSGICEDRGDGHVSGKLGCSR